MKKKYFVFVLYVLFSVMVFSNITAASTGPKAFTPDLIFGFSPVPEGTIITHEFTIKNKGNAVLHVKRVKTG